MMIIHLGIRVGWSFLMGVGRSPDGFPSLLIHRMLIFHAVQLLAGWRQVEISQRIPGAQLEIEQGLLSVHLLLLGR